MYACVLLATEVGRHVNRIVNVLRADTFDVCLCIAVIHHLATEVG